VDTGQQFARIALKTMGDHGFDQRAGRVQKFETCPVWGATQFRYLLLVWHARTENSITIDEIRSRHRQRIASE
jgi:hypothetical protein